MDRKLSAIIKYLIDIKKVNDMTPKKLQKMLYYTQAWHLALTAEDDSEEEISNSLLFSNSFQAWVHGPVIPEVYNKYKTNKSQPILDSTFTDIDPIEELNSDELASIDDVIDIYGGFNGNDLEVMTHREEPWIEARENKLPLDSSNKEINNKTIYNYYSSKLV